MEEVTAPHTYPPPALDPHTHVHVHVHTKGQLDHHYQEEAEVAYTAAEAVVVVAAVAPHTSEPDDDVEDASV